MTFYKYVKLIKKVILQAESIITVSLSLYKHLSIHQEQSIQLTFIILSNNMDQHSQLKMYLSHLLMMLLLGKILELPIIRLVKDRYKEVTIYQNKFYKDLNNFRINKELLYFTHIQIQPPKVKELAKISQLHQTKREISYKTN